MSTTQPSAPSGTSWRMARLTAPLARALAGRRLVPLWAVVHHRGRRTGRALSVPVAVRRTGSGFLVALPWGPRTNWAQNVLAAGGCVVTWRGADRVVRRAELVGPDVARQYFARWQWALAQRLFHARVFLQLHEA